MAGETYISQVLVGKTTRKPGIYFSSPVRDDQQQIVGTLVLKLSGERVHDICQTANVGGEGFISLTDRSDIILAHPDSIMLYKSLAPLSETQIAEIDPMTRYGLDTIESTGLDPQLTQNITSAKVRGSERFFDPDIDQTMIVSYAPMRRRDWVVSVVQPSSDFDQPLRELQRQQTVILLMVGLLATLAGLVMARYFVKPIRKLTHAAQKLAQGDFTTRAPAGSRDELGQLTDAFNDMVPKLQERAQMADALRVAEDIQQGLLPDTVPKIDGLDVAGINIPADQTGGDYFDYLDLSEWKPGSLAIAVGDITGHGIPAALLMCTARALLRSRATPPGPMNELIAGINAPMFYDSPDDRFMTLMYAVIDRPQRSIRLVSAGHDAVIVYDPDTDEIFEIEGHDIPLGIDPDWDFTETFHENLPPRAVLLFGTDGIWESRRPNEGDMYDKPPLFDILRKHHQDSADTIVKVILEDLYAFRGGIDMPQLDDITIVVARLTPLADSAADS